MNIELLKKFIRLANNNPNDHEANSAARRVCKMIAEDDFKCLIKEQTIMTPEDLKEKIKNDRVKYESKFYSEKTGWKDFDLGFNVDEFIRGFRQK